MPREEYNLRTSFKEMQDMYNYNELSKKLSGKSSSKKENDIFSVPFKPADYYDMPRTVHVNKSGKTSMFKMHDSELVGHRSGLLLDNDVYSQHGTRIGRIDSNGYLRGIKY